MKYAISLLFLYTASAFGQVEIYNEDFQNGIPSSYTLVDNDGLTPHSSVSQHTSAWIDFVEPDTLIAVNDSIAASTSYFDPAGQADRWLITDAITLGAYGNFAYWEARSFAPSFPETYYVLVSSTDTQISSFTDTLEVVFNEDEFWTPHGASLSDLGLDNQTVYLAFVNRTNDGYQLFLDDIRVEMEDPVGLAELQSTAVSVYPNPANDYLYIDVDGKIESVTIVDMKGAQLIEAASAKINVHELESGVYFARVRTSTGINQVRFVKL